MQDSIQKEQFFPYPIDRVWRAISQADEISTWFIKADFKAEIGYKFTFTASEEQNCTQITGEVKEAIPYTLVYTWVLQGTSIETLVKWQLEQTENGTKLQLEHSGISAYPGDSAVAMFKNYSGGWEACVNELNKHLEQEVHV
jgi:uncharacterized protein YndB with AHSA1/START domain